MASYLAQVSLRLLFLQTALQATSNRYCRRFSPDMPVTAILRMYGSSYRWFSQKKLRMAPLHLSFAPLRIRPLVSSQEVSCARPKQPQYWKRSKPESGGADGRCTKQSRMAPGWPQSLQSAPQPLAPLLTRFAVETRYPGDEARKPEAEAAFHWAERVRTAARTLLGIRPRRK